MRKRISRWFSLLVAVFTIAATGVTVDAALLDVGPTVPQVLNSTEPNLGHGFPAWYRDTNRLPLELCMNEAMCFFAPPDPLLPVSFPGNMPDEAFYWAAESIITLPGTSRRAILVQALEAAYSTGDVVPAQAGHFRQDEDQDRHSGGRDVRRDHALQAVHVHHCQ